MTIGATHPSWGALPCFFSYYELNQLPEITMPDNPNRRVQLTMALQTVYTSNVTQGYQLTVTASNGNLMPNEIFLWVQGIAAPSYRPVRTWKGVCTPALLQSLPVDNADPMNPNDLFYRSAQMQQIFPSPDEANAAWSAIIAAVQSLKTALDFTDTTNAPIVFWVGTPPGV
jgi:hypothetical protein